VSGRSGGQLLDQLDRAVHRIQQRPTCALLPRSGSSVGIRTSESPPRSKITSPNWPPRYRRRSDAGIPRGSRPGVRRRVLDRVDHLLLGDQTLHRTARDQPLYRPLSSRTSEYCRSTRCSRGADQLRFSRCGSLRAVVAWPANPAARRTPSGRARADRARAPRSPRRRPRARRGRGRRPASLPGPGKSVAAQGRSAHGRRPGRRWHAATVTADRVHGVHRPGQRQVAEVDSVRRAVLDQVEHQRGSTELEIGRCLGEVCVADDDVQPPVTVGVGVRLVAGVDDAALQRGLQPDSTSM